MIITLIVLIPLLIFSLFVFFKLSPKNLDSKKIKIYNLSTIIVAILVSLVFVLRVRSSMIDGSDAVWWPIIAFTFSPVAIIGTFLVSGILRNFIIFRNKIR